MKIKFLFSHPSTYFWVGEENKASRAWIKILQKKKSRGYGFCTKGERRNEGEKKLLFIFVCNNRKQPPRRNKNGEEKGNKGGGSSLFGGGWVGVYNCTLSSAKSLDRTSVKKKMHNIVCCFLVEKKK